MFNLNFITMKKVNTIYETKEYDNFKLLKENREIKKSHVDYFVRELKENGQQIPFKVNKANQILEGQHRFTACKILGISFQFFYSNESNTKKQQLKSLINLQKGLDWSIKNHLDTQVIIGSPNYIAFKALAKKHNVFTLSTIVDLCTGSNSRIFKEGKLKTDHFDFADKVMTTAKNLKDFYKFYNRATFVIALGRLSRNKNMDLDYFLEKAYNYSNLLVGCNGRDAYGDMIINLYNYKKKNKINFYEDRNN
jgi:hypothetical protein